MVSNLPCVADISTTTTLAAADNDWASLFGEHTFSGQDKVADDSATTAAAAGPSDEDNWASLFGAESSSDQHNVAGSNTSNEAEVEDELVAPLDNTAVPTLELPPVYVTAEGSSFNNEIEAEEDVAIAALLSSFDWEEALAQNARAEATNAEAAMALAVQEAEALAVEKPAKRGRGRPRGKKPKADPALYRCRYGCERDPMKGGINLRKHMMRVHGVFSCMTDTVMIHDCGRRYSPSWKDLCCNKLTCKDLKVGSEDWERHHVPGPTTEQEAADTFAYDGTAPSDLVVVLLHHEGKEKECRAACLAALANSAAQAAAAPAQVNNGPSAAGSSQASPVSIDDEDDEDAEWEEDDAPPAKRRRM